MEVQSVDNKGDQERGLARIDAELRPGNRLEDIPESEHLHVCGKSGTESTCGECSECLHGISALDLFNALQSCPTFDITLFSDEKLAQASLRNENDVALFRKIEEQALAVGNTEIPAAVQVALANSIERRRNLQTRRPLFSRVLSFAEGGSCITRCAGFFR